MCGATDVEVVEVFEEWELSRLEDWVLLLGALELDEWPCVDPPVEGVVESCEVNPVEEVARGCEVSSYVATSATTATTMSSSAVRVLVAPAFTMGAPYLSLEPSLCPLEGLL